MPDERPFARRVLTAVTVIGLVALLVYVIVQVKGTLVVAFAAWITAVTLEIVVRSFQRARLARLPAVILTLLLALVVVLLVLAMVVPAMVQQVGALVERLPDLTDRALVNYEGLRQSAPRMIQNLLPPLPPDLSSLLEPPEPTTEAPATTADLLGTVASRAIGVLTDVGSFIGLTVAQVVLYLFLTILLLLEPVDYYQALLALVPQERQARALEIINLVRHNVERWSGAMLISVTVTSLLYFIALGMILQLPNALALSVIAGLATIVPVVGNTLALIPVAIIAGSVSLTKLIVTVILYAAIGMVQDRIVTPAVMRSELNIPAGGLIVFQLVFAALIGPVGLLLAVPLLAIIITLVRELYVFDTLEKRGGLLRLVIRPDDGTLIPADEGTAAPPAGEEEAAAPVEG
ncbi:MAG: hypothetical protein Kow00124_11130 [Anaerolineae bacterium]